MPVLTTNPSKAARGHPVLYAEHIRPTLKGCRGGWLYAFMALPYYGRAIKAYHIRLVVLLYRRAV